jgi:hypothetical protein
MVFGEQAANLFREAGASLRLYRAARSRESLPRELPGVARIRERSAKLMPS